MGPVSVKRKAPQGVVNSEETQFQKEISKILNVQYGNTSQFMAKFQSRPSSVQPYSSEDCRVLGERSLP